MKPIDLIAKALKNSSKSEDIIYDPFGGSGSTLIASEKLNRICYTIELDPKYVDVIVKRWENYTGSKAKKIN
jgi:DNA modification methylase